MAKSYSVADARAYLPAILDDVEAGKEIELTRRGRTVAIVISSKKCEALRREQANFAAGYHAFVDWHLVAEIGLEADFFESLRDQATGHKVRLPR